MSKKYNVIGKNYNQTRKADPYLAERLLYHLNPKKEGVYLDIGCGTGNYTNELQKKGYTCIGIDPSIKMLSIAKKKNINIEWVLGTAEKNGLSNNSIDGIIATLTIHHWNNLNLAFSQLKGVLKEKGNIVLFTSIPKQMKGYWLNEYFPKMLSVSIQQMPSFSKIEKALDNNDFKITATEKYFIQPDLKDCFLYSGKHNPKLYLREDIRNGISSFSSLANQEEVKEGLIRLKTDIDTDRISMIMESYKNNLGDYLYIIGETK